MLDRERGKSTVAAGLFYEMKMRNLLCEIVTEVAKDAVWSEHKLLLNDQLKIFAEQTHRQRRLLGKVDYIITDCPILLLSPYAKDVSRQDDKFDLEFYDNLNRLILATFRQFDNVNFFIKRNVSQFQTIGRIHDLDESILKDTQIEELLKNNRYVYESISKAKAVKFILQEILDE